MSDYTAFLSAYLATWPGTDANPHDAPWKSELDRQEYYGVKWRKVEEFALQNAETRAIAFPSGATSDWHLILARVTGTARLETTGLDTDDATPITGYTPAYGTSILPGVILLSTYNVSSYLFRGQADGTVVELFQAVCE